MKISTLHRYASLLLILLFLFGCAPAMQSSSPFREEVHTALERARHNLCIAEQLQASTKYALDFQEAQNALISAEKYLQDQQPEQAYIAALDSLAATQRIFRQFYKDTMTSASKGDKDGGKDEVRAIYLNDPKNPLREFLPLLNEILDYAEKIESGRNVINFSRVLEDLERIATLGGEARKMSKMLVIELTFAPGGYELTADGTRLLKKIADALAADKIVYESLYPGQTFRVKTKVVGYADQLDFRDETGFLTLLPADVVTQIPQHPIERRQFLNQWLSEFRAKQANAYLQTLTPTEEENMGLGEEIPPEVYPPYPIQDPRRRICKIYGYIALP